MDSRPLRLLCAIDELMISSSIASASLCILATSSKLKALGIAI